MTGDREAIRRIAEAGALSAHRFRYYDFAMAATCVIIVCSNIIGAGKVAALGGFTFGAGVLFFPLSYVLGDVMTEVYGYARARRVVWAGFTAAAFAAGMAAFITWIPPAAGWDVPLADGLTKQDAFALNFGQAPRIVAASCLAIWAGELANAYVMARMKILTRGRWLWTRTIGSTLVGQGIDSLIFYPVAFAGIWEAGTLWTVVAFNWFFKVMVEVVMTPVTYAVVGWLKRREQEDFYDTDTPFTPFSLKD